jgi:hypothetical protein
MSREINANLMVIIKLLMSLIALWISIILFVGVVSFDNFQQRLIY